MGQIRGSFTLQSSTGSVRRSWVEEARTRLALNMVNDCTFDTPDFPHIGFATNSSSVLKS